MIPTGGVLHYQLESLFKVQVMSKGSKIVPVRIPDEMLAEMESAVASQNFHTKGEPLTVSGWIRQCVERELRDRRRKRRNRMNRAFANAQVDYFKMEAEAASDPKTESEVNNE